MKPFLFFAILITFLNVPQCTSFFFLPGCSKIFHTRTGSLFLPGKTHTCKWRISVAEDEKIILNVTSLTLEKSPNCNSGYIEIRDGYWHNSPSLGKFCGNGSLEPIVSSGNKMTVSYTDKKPRPGDFFAKYEAICGEELFIENETLLESPKYPQKYPLNKKCIWKIFVAENHRVVLKFHSFNLENHQRCIYDYVEVRDGSSEESELIGIFCGGNLPKEVISTKNNLLVKFVSDSSIQSDGFSATVSDEFDECATEDHGCAQKCINTLGSYQCACDIGFDLHTNGKDCEKSCGGTLLSPSGTITSPSYPDLYPRNKTCIWEIVTSPENIIRLSFTDFNLEEGSGKNGKKLKCTGDRVEIYSKENNDYEIQNMFCGDKKPQLVISRSNTLRVVFISNDKIQRTGFALDFSTELNKCMINNGNCRHGCLNINSSTNCVCSEDFSLAANGRDCENDWKYEIASLSGRISSNSLNCEDSENCKDLEWLFMTTPGHRVQLWFSSYVLDECDCDDHNTVIYDTASNDLLEMFCYSTRPSLGNRITSSGNGLKIISRNRNNYCHRNCRFEASYSSVCGGTLEANAIKKFIYSHADFASFNYSSNSDCEWLITASSGRVINLSFSTFELEESAECFYDYVEIFNGRSSNSPTIGKFCGRNKPSDISSSTNALFIRFHSDDSLEGQGFSLTYKTTEDPTISIEDLGNVPHPTPRSPDGSRYLV